MNSTSRVLALEYLIALGIVSWSAMKGGKDRGDTVQRYWPWPPTIVMTSLAFALLGLLAAAQPKLAGVLGMGFLSAQLIRALGTKDFFSLSGIPGSASFKLYNERSTQDPASYYRIKTL